MYRKKNRFDSCVKFVQIPNTGVAQTENLYNFITMDTILKT